MKKVLLIIPAYNEEKNISKLIKDIQSNLSRYDYIIINDGSIDATSEICRHNNYNMIELPLNLGLSGAFQTGMKYAEQLNYDYAIQIDGDGQHKVEYINDILKNAIDKKYDITIGSRFVDASKPWNMRMIGSRIISGLIFLTTHKIIKDPTSGMRLFNKRAIKILAHQVNYGPEPDTLSYMLNQGYKIGEVSVSMNERQNGDSYLIGFESIRYMIRVCLSIILMKIVGKTK